MSNWAVIYALFFNFPICKMRGKTVLSQGGYYVASSPVLKTKPETRTISCLMWFVIPAVLQGHHTLKYLSSYFEEEIYHSQELKAYVMWGSPRLYHHDVLLFYQDPMYSWETVWVSMSLWKFIISTREQQNYSGTCEVRSEREGRWVLEIQFST